MLWTNTDIYVNIFISKHKIGALNYENIKT